MMLPSVSSPAKSYFRLDRETFEGSVWSSLQAYRPKPQHYFKLAWSSYFFIIPLVAAALMVAMDGISFLDAWFTSISAMTGSGLTLMSMNRLCNGSIIIIALLALIGSPIFMIVVSSIARKLCFDRVHHKVSHEYQTTLQPRGVVLSEADQKVIEDYQVFADALDLWICISLSYLLCWIFMGWVYLTFALPLQPLPSELLSRGLTHTDNAAFLSLTSFANAGMTITSDSLMGLQDNPPAFLFLSLAILAGNTAAPIFLRGFVKLWLYFSSTENTSRRRALIFILSHPRRLTTHLFGYVETLYLGRVVAIFITVQYLFFLGSTLQRKAATDHHSVLALLEIGFFQTLSTRSAGFCMMDLRELSSGLLVIYLVMMYLSSFPLLSAMQKTEQQVSSQTKPGALLIDPSSGGSTSSGPEKAVMNPLITPPSNHETLPTTELPQDHPDHYDGDKLDMLNKRFASAFIFRHSAVLLLALIICAYSEDPLIQPTYPSEVNLFYIVFEIVSAYGSVGLSLGIPGQPYSLSGAFSTVGRLTIMAVMFLGKHRGLPRCSDEVVDYSFLPCQQAWHYVEEEEVMENPDPEKKN